MKSVDKSCNPQLCETRGNFSPNAAITPEIVKVSPLTLTFEPLLGQPPQESSAVFTERGTLVVVDFEPVRHVDLEALLVDLQHTQ